MEQKTRSRIITGVVFIVLGLVLFGLQHVEPPGQSLILMLLGSSFVGLYLATRSYLSLVVGGILLGIGAGSFGERYLYLWGEFSRIGLGAGFLSIYLIQLMYERRSHWWPLIPGSILILLGLGHWHRVWIFLVTDGWPLILVIIGVLVLLGALGRTRGKTAKPSTGK